jgi:hypothetical protein
MASQRVMQLASDPAELTQLGAATMGRPSDHDL